MCSGRGRGGYTRHHLSDEPHGQNVLALKFEMSHEYSVCMKLTMCIASETIQGSLNLFLSFNA